MKNYFLRSETLQLKGVAILLMMYHHCFLNGRFEEYSVKLYPFTHDQIASTAGVAKVCVSFFVFITGYGLTLSYLKNKESIDNWLLNRYVKLMSGYWIIVICAWSICQLLNGFTIQAYFTNETWLTGILNMGLDFLGVGYLVGTKTMIGTWWYMSAAIIFMLSIPVFNKIIEKIGTVCTVVLMILLPYVLKTSFWGGEWPLTYFLILISGILFARDNLFRFEDKMKNLKSIEKCVTWIFMTIVLYGMIKIYMLLPMEKFWQFHYWIAPLFMIVYCKEYIIKIPLVRNILSFIGKHSMNIFLIHTFFRAVYLTEFVYRGRHMVMAIIILLFVSLLASVILEFFKKLVHYDKMMALLSEYLVNNFNRIKFGKVSAN